MKKKIKYIILFSVLGILGIVYAVFYILYPNETKETTALVLDYVCSKPLPVVGFSALTLGIFIIKIIKVSGIGKKSLNECRSDLESSKQNQEKIRQELSDFQRNYSDAIDAFMAHYQEEFEKFKAEHSEQMKQICDNIPNKNVRELGEKFYGREKEENSEATTD